MAEYTTYLTDNGRIRIVEAIQAGNLQIVRIEASDVDYRGQETQLTSLDGVFATDSVIVYQDGDTIEMRADFNSYGLTEPKEFKTIGIYGKGGWFNHEFLLCVATTDYPATLEPAIGVDADLSRLSFNFYLQIAGAENVTITGTVAGVLYDSDTVNNLTSTSTTAPLSANMGRVLDEQSSAVTDVYGAKNIIQFPYEDGVLKNYQSVTYTVSDKGIISTSGTATGNGWFMLELNKTIKAGNYKLSGCPANGSASKYYLRTNIARLGGATESIDDTGNGATFTLNEGDVISTIFIAAINGTNMDGLTFYPMLRDARITDDTFVPYAKTNLQLTEDKAEKSDISSISVTGTTNTSGAQIDAGTIFYLNGTLCKALTNIGVNAPFTLNTNYSVDTVSAEITPINITNQITVDTSKMTAGTLIAYRIGHLCYIYIDSATFDADADSVSIATGFPKAIVQCGVTMAGANAAQTATIMNSVAYIPTGSTTLKMHISAHATKHWVSLWYICE